MKRVLATGMITVVTSWRIAAGDQWHERTAPASGIPHGIPRICLDATVRSVAPGAWSNPATWSTGRVPGDGDAVIVPRGIKVTYDISGDAFVRCVDVEGSLAFRGDVETRLRVGTITVLENGRLEIGTEQSPIAAYARPEVVIADHPTTPTGHPN